MDHFNLDKLKLWSCCGDPIYVCDTSVFSQISEEEAHKSTIKRFKQRDIYNEK